jgi:MSHA biogenesis protein MshE
VFEDATQVRASDIHIEPQEQRCRSASASTACCTCRPRPTQDRLRRWFLRLKLMSGLDISEKRLPQDGRFNVKVRNVQPRRAHLDHAHAVRRVGGDAAAEPGHRLLTLDRWACRRACWPLQAILARTGGMMLVTGPTGSGKTTTLYAALARAQHARAQDHHGGGPGRVPLPGINQVQVHEKIDLTFAACCARRCARIRTSSWSARCATSETVETGLRAAMTGHLVLSTLHTNDALSTPIRLLDMGAPRYMVALSLQLVIAQRLVRLICEKLRGAPCAAPARERVARAGRGRRCGGSPLFQGERAARTATARAITAHRRLRDAGVRVHAAQLAVEGRTTVAEAMRVSTFLED